MPESICTEPESELVRLRTGEDVIISWDSDRRAHYFWTEGPDELWVEEVGGVDANDKAWLAYKGIPYHIVGGTYYVWEHRDE